MKKYNFLLVLGLLALLAACKKGDSPEPDKFVIGNNRYTMTLDGVEREYYVQVPKNYKAGAALPVVFMLHGTSGNGLDMWERSGWKEVGDTANVITIYPSSLRFCIIDPVDGQKTTTKWNSQPAEWVYCNPNDAKDDIKFLRTVLEEVAKLLSVDSKRVYLVGFSNGGQMAAKCSVFLSDKLAAVCSNASAFSTDTMYNPLRKLPTLFQLGNQDYGPGVPDGPEISLSLIDQVLSSPQYKPHISTSTFIKSFGLSPNYILSGDTSTAVIATYPSLTAGSEADYRFVFVKGLAHAYPNGTNHWMKAAPLHWNWMKQYRLP